eukprot:2095529-Rhodomonas_salina.1
MYPTENETTQRDYRLFHALPQFTRLQSLRLQCCNIYERAVDALVDSGPASLRALRVLNMDSADCPRHMAELLDQLPCLQDYSHRFTWWQEEAVDCLADVIARGGLSSLTRLSLSNTFLSTESFACITSILQTIADTGAPQLESLELCRNRCDIPDEDIYALLRAAERAKPLKQLCLTGNRAVVRELDCPTLTHSKLKRMLRMGDGATLIAAER